MNPPLTADYLEQLRRGLEQGSKGNVEEPRQEIHNVVLAGSGSWGIAARVVEAILADQLLVPVVCIVNGKLPAFVNDCTLCVILSEPGSEHEWAEFITKAIQSNACIISFGEVQNVAQLAAYKQFVSVPMPLEFTRQFSTIGYTSTQLLTVLKQQELISEGFIAQVRSAIALIDNREYFIQDGAENLALGLKDKWPVLYGDETFGAVLQWFQYQINRIGKQQVHVRTFPEIAAAEIHAWKHPKSLLLDTMIVLLTTKFDHPLAKQTIDAIRAGIVPQSGGIAEVMLLYGESFLEQTLYVLHLFDWAAYFLAKENQENL
jgi:glucose/mannose-6-phosphate isomerase